MMTPRPPPAQIAPAQSRLSYPYFNMDGKAMRPMAITDAPGDPGAGCKEDRDAHAWQ